MTHIGRVLAGSRFWTCFVIPQCIFAVVALATDATNLIPILNMVMVALSVGVFIAFSPAVFKFFMGRGPMGRGDALILGIFTTWLAAFLNGTWSLIWRFLGQPAWLANNDFVSYFRYMFVAGAILHLVSPGSISEQIPPRKWLRVGAIVSAAVLCAFFAVWGIHEFEFPG